MRTIRVASRKSVLAMTQTQWVIEQLSRIDPNVSFTIVPIVTKGDVVLDVALSKVGGKGLFVSEIEQALLSGEADMAVHSLKDVPAVLADGLVLAGIPVREDPRDALVSHGARTLRDLPRHAVVGTSSLRRMAQLKAKRPDLDIRPLRGNVDTRLRKLESDGFDAIVLAAAGLHRLGLADRIVEYLHMDVCLPAIGQGILGIECRSNDAETLELLDRFTDPAARLAAETERTLLHELNGGCQVPIGGLSIIEADDMIELVGMVASSDGERILRTSARGRDPVAVGSSVARQLRELGAEEFMRLAEVDPS